MGWSFVGVRGGVMLGEWVGVWLEWSGLDGSAWVWMVDLVLLFFILVLDFWFWVGRGWGVKFVLGRGVDFVVLLESLWMDAFG